MIIVIITPIVMLSFYKNLSATGDIDAGHNTIIAPTGTKKDQPGYTLFDSGQ